MSLHDVGYAGLKDTIATTTQFVTLKNKTSAHIGDRIIDESNMVLTVLGFVDRPVFIGDLTANRFTITATNVHSKTPHGRFVNYFGEQRFSTHNAKIGEAIIKKDYRNAATLIDSNTDDKSSIRSFKQKLEQSPTNAMNALVALPKNLLTLYVHAYQSLLWNKVVSAFITSTGIHMMDKTLDVAICTDDDVLAALDGLKVPLIGLDYDESECDPRIVPLIREVLAQEQITSRSFLIAALPQLSRMGNYRPLIEHIEHLDMSDIDSGQVKISFTLKKGSYATVALRHLIS
jgi:tRNA(Glu) U13 pseudouridine synthase TruD